MAKGGAKAPEQKSQIPTGNVTKLTPTPATPPQMNRMFTTPSTSFAEGMAQSGVGSPQRKFDPALAMEMLRR